jgi:indoleamine 2,3-dioxygenase
MGVPKLNMVPVLSDYGIDPIRGFMPNPPPLMKLPAYFDPWEQIMQKYSIGITSGRLRKWVLEVIFN